MASDLFCRLYVQTKLSCERLTAQCVQTINGTLNGHSVDNSILELNVDRNDDFDRRKFNRDNDFVRARYTIEIFPKTSETDTDVYIKHVCNLISGLRRHGMQVVAACDFEQIVAEKTLWNWTDNDRVHPSFEPKID